MGIIPDDSHIHDGHRSRMRYKLLNYTRRIFDTYELLEMLLYSVIPYKDTNPVAKKLLAAFGGLDGVLSADPSELLTVSGVGEYTADFIKMVGRLSSIIGTEIIKEEEYDFSSYDAVGKYFVDFFSDEKKKCVAAIYLDSSMHLLEIKKHYNLDYSSGGVKAKPFIDEAVRNRATVVITAHNNPYGAFFPTQGDRATNNLITESLGLAGFIHAEHYLVSGNCYAGMGALSNFKTILSQMPAVEEFLSSRENMQGNEKPEFVLSANVDLDKITFGMGSYNLRDFDYFADLLRFSMGNNAENVAKDLLLKYRTIENVFTATARELTECAGEKCAFYIKTLSSVISRRQTDKFCFGRPHTSVEKADYLKALFLGEPNENTYLLTFDRHGNTTGCHFIAEGTVSSSEILPRKALEIAVSSSAKSVSIAHNHPRGTTSPSNDDINVTNAFASIFSTCDIVLKEHYIIAGQRCNVLRIDKMHRLIYDE